MTGPEFWLWFAAVLLTATVGVRYFIAAWRDHDDDCDRFAIGAHRWPIGDDD